MNRALLALLLVGACKAAPVVEPTPPTPPAPAVAAVPDPAPAASQLRMVPVEAKKVRSLGGIDEYVLPNGLTVLLFPDPSQPTVTVNITYLVGSRHEGYGETGMAHLLEHMMFKGSPKHRNVLKLLDERGAFMNGTTWTDRTNYFETLPATADNLKFALELEADRMVNASITPEDLSTEFSVVRNELESGENDPVGVLEERVMSTAYLWHNYGKSTIGSRSDVENVPVDRLRAFYEKYYQPDNAVLVLAGKFDPAAALDLVEATFGMIPRPARTIPATYTVEPVQDGERSVTLRRTGDVHVVMAAYHGVGAAHPDYAAFRALRFILADEPSGRLHQALVEKRLASDQWSSLYAWRDPGFIGFAAKATNAKTVDKLKATLLSTVEGLAKRPVTAVELERWRTEALKNFALGLTESGRTAVNLSEWAAAGDWRLMFAYKTQIESLDLATINRVAVQYLIPSNRTLGEFVPTKDPVRAPLPATPDVAAAVEQIAATAIENGEVFAVDLTNLAKRTTLRRLAGGLEAAFVPKKTRGGKVVVQLNFRHGDVKSLSGKAAIAQLTGALAMRGTKTRSFTALEDEKSKLQANLWVNGDDGEVTVHIETFRDRLPAVLDLAAEIVKTPALDAAELERVRSATISDLEEALTDPNRLAQVALQRTMAPWPAGHPRYTPTISEELAAVKKVTLAQVRAYHAAFWGAGAGEVVAVGDFDADALAAQLDRHFGGWTARTPYVRSPDKIFTAPAGEQEIDTHDKEMAIIIGGHDLALKDDHPDTAALIVSSQIFGGGLGSRLWMRLREKEGWSYGAWGYVVPGDEDPVGQLGFGAILAPQNAAAGKAAVLEEIARLRKEGVTADEVAVAKKAWLEQQDNGLADDDGLINVLARGRYLKRDWAWLEKQRAAVAAVSEADVERVINAWYKPENLIIITAGDQLKAKAGKANPGAKKP
jgi:zinc protease